MHLKCTDNGCKKGHVKLYTRHSPSWMSPKRIKLQLKFLITRAAENQRNIRLYLMGILTTHDANRLKFFTLFLCKIFTSKKCARIITFLNGFFVMHFWMDFWKQGDDSEGWPCRCCVRDRGLGFLSAWSSTTVINNSNKWTSGVHLESEIRRKKSHCVTGICECVFPWCSSLPEHVGNVICI